MKSYRQVLLDRVPAGQRKTRDLVFFHRVHTLSALIRKLEGTGSPDTEPPPTINVTHAGPMTAKEFTVMGSGFLADRQVTIRVVDANALIETRREVTRSTGNGSIRHVIVGDISGLVVNALGIATIAFSATDGRPAPGNPNQLFSNTVRINFP